MWAYETTFYQIYPLGFCGAPRENAAPVAEDELAQAADAAANPDALIMKIAQWADYLQELGIGAVLINPPLESDSHGYDTRSLRHIDRRLGGDADFAAVCETLHAHGIRVVLDAVFNHVGRGFWAFRDVQERKWDSPYKDWFHISFDGDSCYGDGFWYEGWEGHFELVKLNLQNPAVVDYLLESVRRWAEVFGVDGLRLDVAYMLDRDFMRRLHAFARELKPDFVLIGETLHGDYNQIVNDEMLDSCTNYECYKGLYSSFNSVNMFEIAHSLHRQFGGDPWCIYRGKHLLSFVDNHDVPRLASILTDKSCLRPAYGMLFGMPGIPCVYYGSEWGIAGEKGGPDGDWALRPALDAPAPNELTAFITQLTHLRSANDAAARAFNYGAYRNVVIQNKQLLFERACDGATVLVAVNAVNEPYTFGAGELNGSFVDLLADDAPTVELAGTLELAPYEVRYLLRAWPMPVSDEGYQHIEHGFEPVFDRRSRVLVLGSFPSVLSRANAFYYGNPQNRFWRVMAACLGAPVPPNEGDSLASGEPATLAASIAAKRAMLLNGGVALWDVIESCDIKGSSDASIKNVVPAHIERIVDATPIEIVVCNGGTAGRLYKRYLQERTGLPAIVLPSTSPANAAWRLERLVERWSEAVDWAAH